MCPSDWIPQLANSHTSTKGVVTEAIGEKQAVGALPTVACCHSSTQAEPSVLGAVVTQMQVMAGSPSRLCKRRKGTALSVTEPGDRQQNQGCGKDWTILEGASRGGFGVWRKGTDDLGAYVQPWDIGVRLTERKRVGL